MSKSEYIYTDDLEEAVLEAAREQLRTTTEIIQTVGMLSPCGPSSRDVYGDVLKGPVRVPVPWPLRINTTIRGIDVRLHFSGMELDRTTGTWIARYEPEEA